jgi:hypothetical protein
MESFVVLVTPYREEEVVVVVVEGEEVDNDNVCGSTKANVVVGALLLVVAAK